MSHELREGVPLTAVFWSDGEVKVYQNGCTAIVVAEQTGQMAMVPWAKASYDDGREVLYNLALAESVEIRADEE